MAFTNTFIWDVFSDPELQNGGSVLALGNYGSGQVVAVSAIAAIISDGLLVSTSFNLPTLKVYQYNMFFLHSPSGGAMSS